MYNSLDLVDKDHDGQTFFSESVISEDIFYVYVSNCCRVMISHWYTGLTSSSHPTHRSPSRSQCMRWEFISLSTNFISVSAISFSCPLYRVIQLFHGARKMCLTHGLDKSVWPMGYMNLSDPWARYIYLTHGLDISTWPMG